MNQDWLELNLNCSDEHFIDVLEEALFFAGAVSVTYEAADEEEIFEPPIGSTPLWKNTKVSALFTKDSDPKEIINNLDEMLGEKLEFDTRFFANQEWTRAWLDYFKPIRFNGKNNDFYVAAFEHQIDDKNATILRLDPGLAFGTGTHPSTAMCLQFLVENQDIIKNKSVYDYGCGSGILGIAAALLGAEKIYQTDIDPQALLASKDNAEKNNVINKINILENPNDAPQVDFLLANILLEPLCNLKAQFEKHISDKTILIFAGILSRQEALLAEVYSNYKVSRINELEDWICLKLEKKN